VVLSCSSIPFLFPSKLSCLVMHLGIPSLARIRRSELGSYAVPLGIHIGNFLPCGYYSAGDQEEDAGCKHTTMKHWELGFPCFPSADEGAAHKCDHAPTTHWPRHIHRTWAQQYKRDTKVLPAVRIISLDDSARLSRNPVLDLFPLLLCLCLSIRLAYTAGLVISIERRHSCTNDTLKIFPLLKPFTQRFH